MSDPAVKPNDAPVSEMAGTVYNDLLKAELDEERSRKEAVERKGALVVASSAFLISVLSALAVIATRTGTTPSVAQKVCFLISLLLFLASAFLGVRTNRILKYEEAQPASLRKLLEGGEFERPQSIGERATYELRLKELTTARTHNNAKVGTCQTALACELVATVAVAVTTVVVIFEI